MNPRLPPLVAEPQAMDHPQNAALAHPCQRGASLSERAQGPPGLSDPEPMRRTAQARQDLLVVDPRAAAAPRRDLKRPHTLLKIVAAPLADGIRRIRQHPRHLAPREAQSHRPNRQCARPHMGVRRAPGQFLQFPPLLTREFKFHTRPPFPTQRKDTKKSRCNASYIVHDHKRWATVKCPSGT
jgi:hypothetical protein